MPTLTIEFAVYKIIQVAESDIYDVNLEPYLKLTPADLKNFRPSWAAISDNGDGLFNSQKFFGDDHDF